MQFIKKTRSGINIFRLTLKLILALALCLGIVFLLNKIDFPSPLKEVEKTIANENFKVVK
jgi:hypothetical protein